MSTPPLSTTGATALGRQCSPEPTSDASLLRLDWQTTANQPHPTSRNVPVSEGTSNRISTPLAWAILTAVLAAVIIVAVAFLLRGESKDVVVGLGAALASALVTLVLAVLGSQERQQEGRNRAVAAEREERERDRLRQEQRAFGALEFFTGETQRRNVGIAIIEGSWRDAPGMRRIYVPLLVNQASYLLEKSGQKDAAHEIDNCKRIVDLLISWIPGLSPDERAYYDQLQVVIKRRLEENRAEHAASRRQGVDVPRQKLSDWNTSLEILDARQDKAPLTDGGAPLGERRGLNGAGAQGGLVAGQS